MSPEKIDHRLRAVLGDRQLQAGRAQNVPRVVRREMKLRRNLKRARSRHLLHRLQNRIDVLAHIQWFAVLAPFGAVGMPLRMQRVFFLQVRRILQQERGQLDRCRHSRKSGRDIPTSPAPAAIRCDPDARASARSSRSCRDRPAAACSCVRSARSSLEKFRNPAAAACPPPPPDTSIR